MVAEVNYIFGDVLTGEIIAELNLQGVSFAETLSGGEFRGSFHLDRTGYTNDLLLAATIPGRCYVVCERNGVVVGDYILRARTYQSQAKSVQLYGSSWKDYPDYRFIRSDFTATDVEQRALFVSLYSLMQEDPNSAKVALPTPPFGDSVNKSVTVLASEFKTFRQVIDTIADTEDGFDWLIRTHRQGNSYVRTMDVGYPYIGQLAGPGLVTLEYIDSPGSSGGNILNYWANDTMGESGTHFYGIGAGEGDSMLTQEVILADALSAGMPRYDTDYTRKDIADIDLLTKLTYQQALIRRAPIAVLTIELKGDADPPFGSYPIGDACRIVIKDPRFPQTFDRIERILGWTYYPPEGDNAELARLTLEGEDFGSGA